MVNQNEYRKKQTRTLAIESAAYSFKKEVLKKQEERLNGKERNKGNSLSNAIALLENKR